MVKYLLPALAFFFVATPGFGQRPRVEVTVDNLRLEGSTVHAIVRVVNRSDEPYRSVQILCAFLSQERAIDTSVDLVPFTPRSSDRSASTRQAWTKRNAG